MVNINVFERPQSLNEYLEGGGTEEGYCNQLDSHRRAMANLLGVNLDELHAMGPELAKLRLQSIVEDSGAQ